MNMLPLPSASYYLSEVVSLIFMLIFIFSIIYILVIWIIEFLKLMSFKDSQFIGRNDKALWFVFFLVVPFFAPFMFRYFKMKHYTTEE